MNANQFKLGLIAILSIPITAFADVSMELEEACYGDIDLGEYVAQVVENGNSDLDVVSQDEAGQVATFLQDESIRNLSNNEKARAVLEACAQGRIFQQRHSDIINQD